jgi:hypothetical protein
MLSHGACWCDVMISHVKPVMAERHGTLTALMLLVFMMVLAKAMLVIGQVVTGDLVNSLDMQVQVFVASILE